VATARFAFSTAARIVRAMTLRPLFGIARSPRLHAVEVAVLFVSPVLFETVALGAAWREGNLGIDMRQGLLPPAELIRHGISPFAVAHYPPLIPVFLVPFTFLPSPAVLLALLSALCVPVTLWALDIRDWRCYGAAFLWPPVFSGIQTANVTLLLVCVSALAWRYREHPTICAAASGLAVGAKLINLPLVAWLAATGRLRAAVGSVVVALVSTLGLGLVVETVLRSDSHGMLTRFQGVLSAPTPSYSVLDISRSLGASTATALVAVGVVTLALVSACVVQGRRRNDVASFSIACFACIPAAPNVWIHSFAFLLPIVALARPRFSAAWLVPLLLVGVPVIDPSGVEIVFAWLLAGALAFHLLRRDGLPRSVSFDVASVGR
jgi:hypothetical protein